jgi:hypothetical protein
MKRKFFFAWFVFMISMTSWAYKAVIPGSAQSIVGVQSVQWTRWEAMLLKVAGRQC